VGLDSIAAVALSREDGEWAVQTCGYLEHDASASGCNAGAAWCVHVTPITTTPHDPSNGGPPDYADFSASAVTHTWLDAKAAEAGLSP